MLALLYPKNSLNRSLITKGLRLKFWLNAVSIYTRLNRSLITKGLRQILHS